MIKSLDDVPEEQLVSGDDPVENADRTMLSGSIDSALRTLDYRESAVLKLIFGLEDGRAHSWSEVGEMFKLTRSRIGQIKESALKKLRHPTRAKRLKGHLDGASDENSEHISKLNSDLIGLFAYSPYGSRLSAEIWLDLRKSGERARIRECLDNFGCAEPNYSYLSYGVVGAYLTHRESHRISKLSGVRQIGLKHDQGVWLEL